MSRFAPLCVLLPLAALSIPWATGCSGSSGSAGPTPVVLFVDEFDGPKLAQHWVPSDEGAVDLDAGALMLRDDGKRNTARLQFYSFDATNLRVEIRVAPPRDGGTCQSGTPIRTLLLALLDAENGDYVAGVMFQRQQCGNTTQTTFRYWVNDPDLQFFEEDLPNGSITGKSLEFAFRIDAQGVGTWTRDGVEMYAAPFDTKRKIGLLLSSGQGRPALPMRYDSVVVLRE